MPAMRESEHEVRGAYLTPGIPGCGGVPEGGRPAPGDFEVEEIPLAPPGGAGDHLYLWIEKRGLPTLEAVRRLARLAGVPEGEAGYAGLKDARAVARQWISLRCGSDAEARLAGAEPGEGLRVLQAARGRAKLRRGALRGNRFSIRLVSVTPEGEQSARECLALLAARGVPNGFGPQRFGAHGHSAEAGLALAMGDHEAALAVLLGSARFRGEGMEGPDARLLEAARRFEAGDHAGALALYPSSWEAERRLLARLAGGAKPGQAVRAIPARERALYGSALQAAWFNACLALRLGRGLHDRLLPGDVAVSHLPGGSGKARRVGDPAQEAEVLLSFELSPAGPLAGEKMLEARGEPAAIEAEAARRLGFDPAGAAAGLARMGLRGARRAYRARLSELDIRREGEDLRLRFVLPPGAYATEVLREAAKHEPPLGARLGWTRGTIGQGDTGA